jgi:aspartate ammonia-lyase
VHPNDHVNRHQSTNDVYPAACHIAVILTWPDLHTALDSLAVALERQAGKLANQPRIARTCLQDAVAISFADLLGGYVQVIRRGTARVQAAVDALHAVPLGGTIVGRASDVSPAYLKAIVPRLAQVTNDPGYRQSANLFDAAQNLDDLAAVSSALALLASSLIKIAQDFRLMNSGPETGFGEITLPPVQPGSSIMPGKINPVIPEFLIQACFKVVGNDLTCQSGVRHGELDLNVWESAVVFSVLESMPLLQSAVEVFTTRCVAGITVHAARNTANAQTLIPRLTELMKRHGYSTVSQVCHEAGQDLEKLKALLKERFGGE